MGVEELYGAPDPPVWPGIEAAFAPPEGFHTELSQSDTQDGVAVNVKWIDPQGYPCGTATFYCFKDHWRFAYHNMDPRAQGKGTVQRMIFGLGPLLQRLSINRVLIDANEAQRNIRRKTGAVDFDDGTFGYDVLDERWRSYVEHRLLGGPEPDWHAELAP